MSLEKVSNRRALWVGTLWVNGLVMGIFLGGVELGFDVGELTGHKATFADDPVTAAITLALIPTTFVSAWLAWSITVPKWRLWALERVDNWAALEARAIAIGLIWNDRTWIGRIFARTEIWSAKDRARETELLQAKGLPPRRGTR